MNRETENKIAAENMRQRLLEYRAKYGLRQEDFARLAKLERGTIVKAENRKHISQLSEIKILSVINNNVI